MGGGDQPLTFSLSLKHVHACLYTHARLMHTYAFMNTITAKQTKAEEKNYVTLYVRKTERYI